MALTDSDYTTISSISAAIGTLLTGIGLVYAVLQIRWNKQASREAEALQAYRDYLERCVQYPELSSWDMFKKHASNGVKGRVYDAWTLDSERYLWFVSILITTCDEILMNVSDAEQWRHTLETQLEYHKELLIETPELNGESYHDATRKLIEKFVPRPKNEKAT
ncbi:hypothetical protein [Rhizobium binae]|uniref:hypothetical protein n=1 Tax=Rhizobium binae TaxID=1138190 RepID=UPI001C82824A|nr:hypothetical protein [Rhizobium binae]MBX4967821.1 hypothetical protein [Rhizobium binae]